MKLALALLTIIVSEIMVFLQPLSLILNDITFLPVSLNCIHVESPLPRIVAPDHSYLLLLNESSLAMKSMLSVWHIGGGLIGEKEASGPYASIVSREISLIQPWLSS